MAPAMETVEHLTRATATISRAAMEPRLATSLLRRLSRMLVIREALNFTVSIAKSCMNMARSTANTVANQLLRANSDLEKNEFHRKAS